jgi:hypothetical protein
LLTEAADCGPAPASDAMNKAAAHALEPLRAAPQASPERMLLDFAQRIERTKAERIAAHVQLAQLQPHHRSPNHLRIAVNTFEACVQQLEGQFVRLSNDDLVFIGRTADRAGIESAVARLRLLFSTDPLVRDAADEAFCRWYGLADQFTHFTAMVARLAEPDETAARPGEKPGIDAGKLQSMQKVLARVDISPVVRNQPVCALVGADKLDPVFRELYVSMKDLASLLVPECDLATNRWLFLSLTETLDQRMLAFLTRELTERPAAISFNANLRSIMTADFDRFDRSLRPNLRGRLLVEIGFTDVIADVGAFHFAREYLHEREYKLCLDGVTDLSLPFVDRTTMNVDIVKLRWTTDFGAALAGPQAETIRARLTDIGLSRVVLCHCDTHAAVEAGARLGIRYFQGRAIDKMLAGKHIPPSVWDAAKGIAPER